MDEWLRDAVPGYISDITEHRITVAGAWSAAPSCSCVDNLHNPDAAGRLPSCAGDRQVVEALNCLVDRGFMLMDWSHSWPPAATADDLRDRGFTVNSFRILTFDGTWFRAV